MVNSCEPQTQRYEAQRYKGMTLYHVISTSSEQQPVYETLLKWSCSDECKYTCMWITVDAFQRDGMDVPQFYGKVSITENQPSFTVYQSPLILTELFQHNLINVSYLTACYLYRVMMMLHFLNDVANDAESTQK